jgi:acetyltransferase-like isoleucine patch superfamily enzyme
VLIKKVRIPVKQILLVGFLPSFLKKIIYRLKGYEIGSGVKLSFGSVIIGKEVSIGQKTSIGFFTILRANKISLGRFVKIGAMSAIDTESFLMDDDARINEQVYIGGIKKPNSSFVMGKRTIIMQGSYLNPTEPITIGDDSGIGGNCLLFTHGSWNSQLEGYPVKFAPITIGKKVWLPWRVFVMPGVTIGDGAVIGADSTINKDVPARALAAGSPAKIIKENVAVEPSAEEKKKIIQNILSEFKGHLQHYGFTLNEEKNRGQHITIKGKHGNSSIVHTATASVEETPQFTDNILVVDTATPEELKNVKKFSMAISLSSNSRMGTSQAGEELVNFFSRYGVRFNRLD